MGFGRHISAQSISSARYYAFQILTRFIAHPLILQGMQQYGDNASTLIHNSQLRTILTILSFVQSLQNGTRSGKGCSIPPLDLESQGGTG